MPTVAVNTSGRIALEIDGANPVFASTVTPPILSFAAGGAPTLGEFEASVNLSEAGALLDWVMALPRRKVVESAGAVLVANHNLDVQRRIDWTAGVVTRLSLGTLDARDAKKNMAMAVRWWAPNVVHRKDGSKLASSSLKRRKAWLSANFRLKLGDLPVAPSQVVKVELPTVSAKVGGPGETHDAAMVPDAEFGPLRMTVLAGGIAAALEWIRKLQDHGGALDTDRMDFSVEMLDAALAKTLGTIELQGCLLQSWEESKFEAGGSALRSAVMTFSVQGLDLRVGAG